MHNLENQRFGHLVVINRLPGSKWICRCDCGKEIIVNTQYLLKGATKSCGCVPKKSSNDITGQRFNRLTVITHVTGKTWLCRCDCGNEVIVYEDHLMAGKNKSCGCLQKEKVSHDITGQRFGHLTAIESTGNSIKYSAVWRFLCDCGREVEATYDSVKWGERVSCSYCKAESQRKRVFIAQENLERIEGTEVNLILSKKLNKNNTSGCKGVYWVNLKQKWAVKIQFKGIIYNLGYYEKIEDAVKIRKAAEDRLYGPFLEWYEEYKKQNNKN